VNAPPLLHDALWRAAAASPEATAVVHDGDALTYEELATAAGALAELLITLGAGPGARVAVHLERSIGAVVALYAVLASGAACVPLDPDAPATRVATILRDCGVNLLVSETAKAGEWAPILDAGAPVTTVIVPATSTADVLGVPDGVNVIGAEALATRVGTRPATSVSPSDLAYLLYTSGSTGAPKGICLTHANVGAFVAWAASEFAVASDDRLASHAPFHFDLSLFDLYAAAHAGATVVLAPRGTSAFPRETARFIAEHHITVWYSVPWVLAQLAERGGLQVGDLPGLRAVLFAGEVFPHRPLQALRTALPDARLANLYGPTECNVCSWYEVPEDLAAIPDPLPIGRAIAGVDLAVVTDGASVGPGEVGELFVRGPTVMQGYWADPERTAAALVPNPWELTETDRGRTGPWLRTGDLAEPLADGTLRFHGRRDDQVKHRGHRVELGDVEAAIAAHPAVTECAVTVVPDRRKDTRLVAHVVVGGGVTGAELRRTCAERLPRSVVPDEFHLVGTIPRTSTGKIDRRALASHTE
jgi:amino acid adenylation domain-containing protein